MSDDATLRDAAIRLLARREYARAELARRLAGKGHGADAIAACLDALTEDGLQSDARFAESFLRSRIARGQGPLKIRLELEHRGVERATIRAAFESARVEGVDWFALATEALTRRFAGPGEGPRERARQARFLAGRGFEHDQVQHALAQAWR
jgi:regulatory protein